MVIVDEYSRYPIEMKLYYDKLKKAKFIEFKIGGKVLFEHNKHKKLSNVALTKQLNRLQPNLGGT